MLSNLGFKMAQLYPISLHNVLKQVRPDAPEFEGHFSFEIMNNVQISYSSSLAYPDSSTVAYIRPNIEPFSKNDLIEYVSVSCYISVNSLFLWRLQIGFITHKEWYESYLQQHIQNIIEYLYEKTGQEIPEYLFPYTNKATNTSPPPVLPSSKSFEYQPTSTRFARSIDLSEDL